MSAHYLSALNGASNSMKLILFFRIVSVFGGMVLFARALIFVAVVSGILYFLP